MKLRFKKVVRLIAYHGKILLRGFIKMLFGTLVAVLMAVSVYGFVMIPQDKGYNAVFDFAVAAACMVLAMGCVYVMGGRCKKSK